MNRDNPRFIQLMDAYVDLIARDAEEFDPDVSRQLSDLASQIEDEFGQGALEEAKYWEVPSMRVSELIQALQDMDQDAEVHFTYNYGDYWHTQVAPKVQRVEEGAVVYSKYHNMPKIDDSDNGEMTKVILS